jgi:hypothetical protein
MTVETAQTDLKLNLNLLCCYIKKLSTIFPKRMESLDIKAPITVDKSRESICFHLVIWEIFPSHSTATPSPVIDSCPWLYNLLPDLACLFVVFIHVRAEELQKKKNSISDVLCFMFWRNFKSMPATHNCCGTRNYFMLNMTKPSNGGNFSLILFLLYSPFIGILW